MTHSVEKHCPKRNEEMMDFMQQYKGNWEELMS
jgi:hypothetical protein